MAKAAKAKSKPVEKKSTKSRTSPTADPTLMEFFKDEIKDIYWAEKRLTTALPKMKKAASSPELANAIGEHLEVTRGHVTRLEQVFELLGQKPRAKKCEAMAGILKEGDEIVEETEKGTATRDVGIILAGQKVEHYEISTYGGLKQLATTLGLNDVAAILGQTLEEEKQADQTLSDIAENSVNYNAAEEEAE